MVLLPMVYDTNEIYMKYTLTNDKMATVNANEKKTFNKQRIYKGKMLY